MNSDPRIELRKKLLRRLIWKVPLIIALVSFALWWELNHISEREVAKESTATNSPLSNKLTGGWSAEVTYSSGERQREQFFFQTEGNRLYGTASFHGNKRGIEDGKIFGSIMSFSIRFEEIVNGAPRLHVNRYEGALLGNEIYVKLFADEGSPPVEFRLVRNDGASGKP